MTINTVQLKDAPYGMFLYEGTLCLKTQYAGQYFVIPTGAPFWGGTDSEVERDNLLVIPVSD